MDKYKYNAKIKATGFEWDIIKDVLSQAKHGVSFVEAQQAFEDVRRVIQEDLDHGRLETRYYCYGLTHQGVLTVRFTHRGDKIRIIGAGYWRKGRKIYEEKNQIHGRADRAD